MSLPRSAGASTGVTALLIAVMLGWGLNIPAVKALTDVMDVVWVAVVRMGFAFITLTGVLLLRDRRFPRLSRWIWRHFTPRSDSWHWRMIF